MQAINYRPTLTKNSYLVKLSPKSNPVSFNAQFMHRNTPPVSLNTSVRSSLTSRHDACVRLPQVLQLTLSFFTVKRHTGHRHCLRIGIVNV